METKAHPIIVVMTQVRNDAWVLRAFLEATSLWADYILIADRMSTDGSREIAQDYPKVILIDDYKKELDRPITRRLLFEAAKKIDGDKLLFALDADEFLSGDFANTADWKKMMNSKPGDAFCWRWMDLKRNDITKYSISQYYYWCVHESETFWEDVFSDNYNQEWRLQWSPNDDERQEFFINDFYSIHLSRAHQLRQRNKDRFCQVSAIDKVPKMSRVALYRQYHREDDLNYKEVPRDMFCFYEKNGLNIWDYVNLSDAGEHYTSEILRCFQKDGMKKYALLDIWDEDWMTRNGLKDPRNVFHKLLLGYLHKTSPYANSIWVRSIDKMFKLIA
jgi:hypothetical protein